MAARALTACRPLPLSPKDFRGSVFGALLVPCARSEQLCQAGAMREPGCTLLALLQASPMMQQLALPSCSCRKFAQAPPVKPFPTPLCLDPTCVDPVCGHGLSAVPLPRPSSSWGLPAFLLDLV